MLYFFWSAVHFSVNFCCDAWSGVVRLSILKRTSVNGMDPGGVRIARRKETMNMAKSMWNVVVTQMTSDMDAYKAAEDHQARAF